MEAGLIITVGTTAEPLVKAIEEAANENITFIYLLYGRPFPDQTPNPFDIANEVKKKACSLNLNVRTFEIQDPEDFGSCLSTTSHAINQINENGIRRLVVNFTGGTKPMSAALTHGVLIEPVDAEVVLDYTGGIARNGAGRVTRGAMRVKRHHETRIEKIARDALNLLKYCQYSQAFSITRSLPDSGRFGFLKRAIEALDLWDNFHYQESSELLKKLRPQTDVLTDVPLPKDILEVIKKLIQSSFSISNATNALSRIQNGDEIKKALKGISKEELFLVPADALENAGRRFLEKRYTDAVLRAYRAIESAVQIKLISVDINPWDFDIERIGEEKRQQFSALTENNTLTSKLTISSGLNLLKVFNKGISEELENTLKEIQATRNNSYLEHGYHKVNREQAERIMENAVRLVGNILEIDVKHIIDQIKHEL
ncbi:MAG: TIGR02710 family CRISPR-associated CARF protein [Thermodesulfovibrionales bacterium]|nr:TIGR02710 family CRISPR-associated CARF protein [Thermodesulfovibrionales bacterium]